MCYVLCAMCMCACVHVCMCACVCVLTRVSLVCRKNRAMAQLIAQHWTPVNGEQDGAGGGGMRGANDVAAGGVDVDGREAGVDAGADAPGLEPEACKCTLGFSYSEANSIITDVIPGGPAHYSNKVFVGDTIVAVDGVHVRGAEIARCFEGVHKPGSILHLTLKRQSGVVEQVAMRRMAKELFDHHAFSALQTQVRLACESDLGPRLACESDLGPTGPC